MGLRNAKDTLLGSNPGTLPDVSDALLGWFQKMRFVKIAKSVVNFKVVELATPFETMGVRQPFTAQQLMMKPEGQRKWLWQTMHALPDTVLRPDDVIVFGDIPYRVMEKLNWTEYGFVEYHIVQAYNSDTDFMLTQDGEIVETQGGTPIDV